MSDFWLAIVLGIIEGITEFIPVSSTAHLRIAERLLDVRLDDGFWKMFAIVIQLGPILCLPIYFWGHLTKLVSTFPRGRERDRTVFTHPLSLTTMAFVVTAVPSFLLTKLIGKNLESFYVIGTSLLVGGIIMWVVDRMRAPWEAAGPNTPGSPIHTWKMDNMGSGQALWIGACQILSGVFPGTSRSMSTIAAGQIGGMSRAAALEFSFFLSIPTMAAATIYTLLKSMFTKDPGSNAIGVAQITPAQWGLLGIGFVVAFIVAYGSVAWFMAWVRNRGFVPFAIYRILLGIAVLAFAGRLAG